MRPDHDPIELVVLAPVNALETFAVSRALPTAKCRAVGPVVFLDHVNGALAPGQGFDVRPHPHIGLSTVTYLLEGEFVHRDSLGYVQTIRPGAINLMTAGAGITHSERTSAETRARGGRLSGVQLWVAMPAANEDDDAAFAHHPEESIPEVRIEGGHARILVGETLGARSPAQTESRAVLAEVRLARGAAFAIPADLEDAALYLMTGAVAHGEERFDVRSLIVRRPGAALTLHALEDTRALLIGGPRLEGQLTRDPRLIEWNFVATTRERLEAAKDRWRARKFPLIPGDSDERIPLPDELRAKG
jgi:redox-sensitive bicupin YhaK (pirin superfamily)